MDSFSLIADLLPLNKQQHFCSSVLLTGMVTNSTLSTMRVISCVVGSQKDCFFFLEAAWIKFRAGLTEEVGMQVSRGDKRPTIQTPPRCC